MDEKKEALLQLGWSEELIQHFLIPGEEAESFESVQDLTAFETVDSANYIFSISETPLHGNMEISSNPMKAPMDASRN
jgi:hypothetical protein